VNLRPYQLEALQAVKDSTVPRGIVTLPTGSGKGHIAGNLTEAMDTQNVLYLAHREELISQLYHHVERVVGVGRVGVEQAGNHAGFQNTVIASVPTLAAMGGRRMDSLDPDRFEAIVLDEAHHCTADSYMAIWQHFGLLDEEKKKIENPDRSLIGLTATPGRGDGVGLHNVFDDIIFKYELGQAIRDGWLVPVHAYTIHTGTDLSDVKKRAGDYAVNDLSDAVDTEERNAAVFEACGKYAPGLKTLVFCVTLKHAEDMANHFAERGREARFISGKMGKEERARLFNWFKATPGAVLCNVQLFTEGVDIPSIEAVALARPTQSATLFAQMLGRGTRLAEGARDYEESRRMGKDKVVVLDVTDSTAKLGKRAVRIGDIFGSPLPTEDVAGDILEAVEEQEQQVEEQQAYEAKTVVVRGERIDLFAEAEKPAYARLNWLAAGKDLRLSLPDWGAVRITTDALDRHVAEVYDPESKAWGKLLAEPEQKDAVLGAEKWVTEQHAESMVLMDRSAPWRQHPASEKQLALCQKKGIPVPEGVTKGQVAEALDRYFTAKKR